MVKIVQIGSPKDVSIKTTPQTDFQLEFLYKDPCFEKVSPTISSTKASKKEPLFRLQKSFFLFTRPIDRLPRQKRSPLLLSPRSALNGRLQGDSARQKPLKRQVI